jgi:4-hydroxy-tetrahydrodipicolinate reductase
MKLAVIGCTGRMGRAVITEAIKDDFFNLSGGYVRKGSNFEEFDLGEIVAKYPIKVKSSSNLENTIKSADIIIDFSSPEVCIKSAEIAAKNNKKFISGTTGLNEKQLKKLKELGKKSLVIWSQNMSIGINLLALLVNKACTILGKSFDTEIIERHHKHKKDAPSGSAILLGQEIADAKNLDFAKIAKFSRSGVNESREENEIGFSSIRASSIVGEHDVLFANESEQITISHKAIDRNIFALGALKAAKWSKDKKSGFYTMKDVLLG